MLDVVRFCSPVQELAVYIPEFRCVVVWKTGVGSESRASSPVRVYISGALAVSAAPPVGAQSHVPGPFCADRVVALP